MNRKILLFMIAGLFSLASCKKFGEGIGSYQVHPEEESTPGDTVQTPVKKPVKPPVSVNHTPELTMPGEIFLLENQPFSDEVTFSDADNDAVEVTLSGAPSALVFDSEDNSVAWTPTYEDAGDYSVLVRLDDGKDYADYTVTLKVINVNRAPSGTAVADKTSVKSGETVTFTSNITDPDLDILQYEWDFGDGTISEQENPVHVFPDSDVPTTYNVKLTVSDGIDDFSTGTDILVDKAFVLAESGRLDVTTEWQQVLFSYKIIDPVVVAGSLTANDTDHAAARIRNVTEQGFEIMLQEDTSGDGSHSAETASWFAISSGKWTTGTGMVIAAGRLTTEKLAKFDSGFDSITHNLGTTPVVIGQVAGDVYHNSASVFAKNRVISCDTVSCTIALDADESIDDVDGPGVVNWIATASGQTLPNTGIVTGVTDSTQGTVNYSVENPAVFAAMQTRNGSDCSNVRFSLLTDTSASVFISEDLAGDSESNHVAEDVGYFVISEGVIDLPQSTISDTLAFTTEGVQKDVTLEVNAWGAYLVTVKEEPTHGSVTVDSPNKKLTYIPSDGFVGIDSVVLSLLKGSSEVDTATVTINVLDDVSQFLVGEVGEITLDGDWVQVSFTDPVPDPVVIIGPSTTNEDDPASIRIRNLDPYGFEVKIIDSDLSAHVPETASWMVVKKGKWTLQDGTVIEAGSVNTTAVLKAGSSETVSFESSYAAAPVVFIQNNSFNNDMYLNSRVDSVSTGSIVMGNDPAENVSSNLANAETIGWVAISPQGATGDNVATQGSLTNSPLPFAFSSLDGYGLMAGMQTRNGGDPCVLKIDSIAAGTADLFLLEDQLNDTEQTHGSAEKVTAVLLPLGSLYKAF